MPSKPRVKPSSSPAPQTLSGDIVSGAAALTSWDRHGLDTARRLSPVQADALLRGATDGEPQHTHELFNAMIRSWPRLAKNIGKVRTAASKVAGTWTPWMDPDGNVPEEAKERARTVERAMRAANIAPGTLEVGEAGLKSHFAECVLRGTGVAEMLWHTTDDGAGLINAPRAFRPTHPYYYAWPHTGRDDKAGDRLLFRRGGQRAGGLEEWPANQFAVQITQSWFDHPALASILGTLVPWWISANYGPQWMANYAQMFGEPFLIGKYPTGDTAARDALAAQLSRLSRRWAALPDTCELDGLDLKLGGDQPHEMVVKLADTICDITLLGQSLTTDTGGVGSQALGNVHEGVELSVMRGLMEPVCDTLTNQVARAILRLNYGDDRYCPTYDHGLTEPEDEKAKAERDEIIVRTGGRLPKAWYYERHGIPMPAEGEETIGSEATTAPEAVPGVAVKAAKAAEMLPDASVKELEAVFDKTLQEAARRGWEAAKPDNSKPDNSQPDKADEE